MTVPKLGTSVVICTYNGGSRIERVLAALNEQVGSRPFEVILIDNRSTDGVGATASAYWEREGRKDVPFRVVVEDDQGLSYARRRGAMEAQHELVLFCDDDNLLCPIYVEEAARLMDDPRFAVVGGAGIPIFEAPPPSFMFTRGGFYAIGDRYRNNAEIGAEHVILSDGEPSTVSGAGLVARRDDLITLFSLPGFPVNTDRKGTALSGGNDCEINFMLMIAGGKLLYSDRLRFHHIIPANRLSAEYLHRLIHEAADNRMYWKRLADYYVARRDGIKSVGVREIARAIRSLFIVDSDRSSLFRIFVCLGIRFKLTQIERTAANMGEQAMRMPRAYPSNPREVELSLVPAFMSKNFE